MRQEYAARWADKTRVYDGIIEMLDGLVARKLSLCILTNKPQDFSEKIVAKLLAKWRFEPLVGARPNVPKKPDPSAALAIVVEMKIPAEQFLYLGDTGIDMKTAVAAGMYPVGAVWGFRTADELRESGARTLIADPRELLTLV
jgi:phosphoglycolate phosphatase